MRADRSHIVQLQTEILRLQGFKPFRNPAVDLGLGGIAKAFPEGSFPLGAVHEFLSTNPEEVSATTGFITGLLSHLMAQCGTAMWISAHRTIFPPALIAFGVQPDRIIFIDLRKESDVLWAVEEALKCAALTAVVCELQDITFTASRRLQLAVEQSQVTGFILRNSKKRPGTTACVSRWKILPIPSEQLDNLPGVGFPQWKVDLLRIRNGKPGVWTVRWMNGRFDSIYTYSQESPESSSNMSLSNQRKAG